MKLRQLIESFVISNDEFEDYLERATEQLVTEIQSGKNARDAVHDLSVQFSKMHNSAYAAYTRMSDSLFARLHTLELEGSESTDMMGAEMGGDPEMLNDPMGSGMEMDVPPAEDMPMDQEMDDYNAVMANEPEIEENVQLPYGEGEGTYARITYDYSDDWGAIDIYKGHDKVDEWDGYFGANETGNPLAAKFVKMAKANGLDPMTLPLVDENGDNGKFDGKKFQWNEGIEESKKNIDESLCDAWAVTHNGKSVAVFKEDAPTIEEAKLYAAKKLGLTESKTSDFEVEHAITIYVEEGKIFFNESKGEIARQVLQRLATQGDDAFKLATNPTTANLPAVISRTNPQNLPAVISRTNPNNLPAVIVAPRSTALARTGTRTQTRTLPLSRTATATKTATATGSRLNDPYGVGDDGNGRRKGRFGLPGGDRALDRTTLQPSLARVFASKYAELEEGWETLKPIDKEKYQERPGLEGPFQTRVGKVVYYDPKEGSYYDPDTDMYMSYEEWKALDGDEPLRNEAREAAEELFAGWIAFYNGKKLKIRKDQAKDIYNAKLKAIKHFKVPKSKQGILAIEPAYEELNEKTQLNEFLPLAAVPAAVAALAPHVARVAGGALLRRAATSAAGRAVGTGVKRVAQRGMSAARNAVRKPSSRTPDSGPAASRSSQGGKLGRRLGNAADFAAGVAGGLARGASGSKGSTARDRTTLAPSISKLNNSKYDKKKK